MYIGDFKETYSSDQAVFANTTSRFWLGVLFVILLIFPFVAGDYFLFMADTEICFQAWKNSCRVVYFPEVKVFADGKRLSAGGFKKFFKSRTLRQHVKDSLKYRAKHFFDKNPRIAYFQKKEIDKFI